MVENSKLENLLEKVSKKHKVSSHLILKMLDIERDKLHLERRRGILKELQDELSKELKIYEET